jgi:hypothetical protein
MSPVRIVMSPPQVACRGRHAGAGQQRIHKLILHTQPGRGGNGCAAVLAGSEQAGLGKLSLGHVDLVFASRDGEMLAAQTWEIGTKASGQLCSAVSRKYSAIGSRI